MNYNRAGENKNMKINLATLVGFGLLAMTSLGFSQTVADSTTGYNIPNGSVTVRTITTINQNVVPLKAKGQVKAQSVALTETSTGWSFTYLRDGYDGLVGITGKLTPLQPRLSLNALVVTPTNSSFAQKAWVGAALQYDLLGKNGWDVSVLGGYKGYDVTTSFANQTLNKNNLVVGFTLGRKF